MPKSDFWRVLSELFPTGILDSKLSDKSKSTHLMMNRSREFFSKMGLSLQRSSLVIQRNICMASVGWWSSLWVTVMLKGFRDTIHCLNSVSSQCFLIFNIIVFEEH